MTTMKESSSRALSKPSRVMSDDHKAKLAQGRTESRVVSRYLEALEAGKGRRGRKRTPESISIQLTKLEKEIESASPIRRLELTQKRFDLALEKDRLEARSDIAQIERDFIKIAKTYAHRNGISYSAFRELGVPADVLKRSGISRAEG